MSGEAQTHFIPAHDGQPSLRSAWGDPGLNRDWGDFYLNTAETLEAAYVRPRHAGYIQFQGAASALLRDAFSQGIPAAALLDELQLLYYASRVNGGER
jgi:multiple sugar transport system substrate-binding protein